MNRITLENAYIFRITHIDNVPWILHCRNSHSLDPEFSDIGSSELIEKRKDWPVPVGPGGTLSDYVPFYFTHSSPMLLNIKTGYSGVNKLPMSEIVILVSSLPHISKHGLQFVFTDRHAKLEDAVFYTAIEELEMIDWKLIASRDFSYDPDFPLKKAKYMAEALIHRLVPVPALLGLACYGPQPRSRLLKMQEVAGVSLKTVVMPDWYF